MRTFAFVLLVGGAGTFTVTVLGAPLWTVPFIWFTGVYFYSELRDLR